MERTGFEQWKPREVARLLALLETERRYYQEMVAVLPAALAVLTQDRSVVSANRAFHRLTGLRAEELRHKTIEQVFPSDELIERIRGAHVHGDVEPFVLNIGERRMRIAAIPIRGWEEEAEPETLLMLEDLKELATPVAAPLEPAQPSAASSRVEALQALAARLAHDLNNPLMIVTGYAEEMLNALPAGDPKRSDLAEMLTAAGRIRDLAAQLLDYTRPQAKPPARIQVNRVLKSLEPRLRQLAGESAPLELAAGDAPVWAFADAEQLGEAVAALAAAALENTQQVSRLSVGCGGGRISIHAAGRGSLPAGVLESFLPSKDPHKTAGPSAARAYLNIRQWGGEVSFSSSAEQGSLFVIHLPQAEGATPLRASAGETILVVEDEPGIRALVCKILRRERYQVLEAASAEEALPLAGRGGIDLLLTDVMLPGMRGPELAKSLLSRHPRMKVVYVSGYAGEEAVHSPPGSKFLQKPFTLGALIGVVREALKSTTP